MTERFGWTKTEANIPFLVFIFMSAVMTIPAGKLQDKVGLRKTGILAAILFFIAYALAAQVGKFPHTWYLIVTYGLLGGTAGEMGGLLCSRIIIFQTTPSASTLAFAANTLQAATPP